MSQTLEHTAYHSLLRVGLAVCAVLLVFDSGLVSPKTSELSQGAQQYLAAAVGVKVSVPENEMNVLTARITELEGELAAKDREIRVAQSGGVSDNSSFDVSTFVLSVILFILLVLIVMNYILDYLRYRSVGRGKRVVTY